MIKRRRGWHAATGEIPRRNGAYKDDNNNNNNIFARNGPVRVG